MQLLKAFVTLGVAGLVAAQNNTARVNSTSVGPPLIRTPIVILPTNTSVPTVLPSKPAYYNATVVIVKSYTTWCPGPTVIVVNHKSYTAKGPTMLTITNCPCTITKPVKPLPTPAPPPVVKPTPTYPPVVPQSSAAPVPVIPPSVMPSPVAPPPVAPPPVAPPPVMPPPVMPPPVMPPPAMPPPAVPPPVAPPAIPSPFPPVITATSGSSPMGTPSTDSSKAASPAQPTYVQSDAPERNAGVLAGALIVMLSFFFTVML